MAASVNSTTVEVTWDPPSITNGILRYYTVVYGSSDDMDSSGMGQDISSNNMKVNVTTDAEDSFSGDGDPGIATTLLVSGLNPFTNYTFYVLAVTVAPSEPGDSVTVLTDEASKTVLLGYSINVTGSAKHFIAFLIACT